MSFAAPSARLARLEPHACLAEWHARQVPATLKSRGPQIKLLDMPLRRLYGKAG